MKKILASLAIAALLVAGVQFAQHRHQAAPPAPAPTLVVKTAPVPVPTPKPAIPVKAPVHKPKSAVPKQAPSGYSCGELKTAELLFTQERIEAEGKKRGHTPDEVRAAQRACR